MDANNDTDTPDETRFKRKVERFTKLAANLNAHDQMDGVDDEMITIPLAMMCVISDVLAVMFSVDEEESRKFYNRLRAVLGAQCRDWAPTKEIRAYYEQQLVEYLSKVNIL
jgi:hypothetical protein